MTLLQPRPHAIGQGEVCLLDLLGEVLKGGSCLLSLLTAPDLEQQLEQLNAKIRKTHEEVSFLSTYMDHDYPVKLVQIADLVRQLQQVKDSQQVGKPLALPCWTSGEAGLAANSLLLAHRMNWMTSVRCTKWSWSLCLIRFR